MGTRLAGSAWPTTQIAPKRRQMISACSVGPTSRSCLLCPAWAGYSPTRSRPRSATSAASPPPRSSPATPASVPASTNRAKATAAVALQAGPPLPPLGADRGDQPRLPASRLRRPLRADQAPARQAARPQGRSRPTRAHPRPCDLAHAPPQPTLRSGERHRPPGRLTARKELRPRSGLPPPFPPQRRR